jgi:RND family efflux transporter MFP subunit
LIRFRRMVALALVLAGAAVALYTLLLRPRAGIEHRVARGEVQAEVFGTGTLESRRIVGVGFEVTGRIARLEADQGDTVEPGQLLGTLDDETFRADLAAAEEDVRFAEAGLERLAAEQVRADAVLGGARANVVRVRELHAKRIAAQDQLDEAEERLKIAEADAARARAARHEGELRLAIARKGLERAQALLARTVVRSPFRGLVLRREREVGDVVVPGASVLRLAATDQIWASVWVDESFLGVLHPELPARIVLRSESQQPFPGRVVRIGREVDRETRELLVDVSLAALPRRYAVGQRVDVWIEVARIADALRLPPEFVAHADGRAGAFVLEAGRVRFRPLELGARGREWIEVRNGLSAGQSVVRPAQPGSPRLAEGQRIRPLSEAKP